jgi:hypothetical protein
MQYLRIPCRGTSTLGTQLSAYCPHLPSRALANFPYLLERLQGWNACPNECVVIVNTIAFSLGYAEV